MDSRQPEYILKIAEERNITRAAEKLYISQSALNQQLLNLEKNLGTQLFIRSNNICTPTEAGDIYIRMAKQILALKREAYAQIADVAEVKKEDLSIGITPGKGGDMMADIYKQFYVTYPQVRLQLHQAMGIQLHREVASGELDVAVLTIGTEGQRPHIVYEDLLCQEMLLAMSKDHPLVKAAIQEPDGTWVQDLKNFQDEKFVLGSRLGINRAISEAACEEAGFTPNVYFENAGQKLNLTMVEMGLCCCFLEEHYRKSIPENVAVFKLTSHPLLRVVAIHKEGKYLSQSARAFIALAKTYWGGYEL